LRICRIEVRVSPCLLRIGLEDSADAARFACGLGALLGGAAAFPTVRFGWWRVNRRERSHADFFASVGAIRCEARGRAEVV
jgi:hypothetical protein